MKEMLSIVSEEDEVIGEAERQDIHLQGLLHREIHVYFVTPNKEIIFQHRAKDKDTFPDLLDATVGGHVEIGMSYEETAIKETEEETGIKVNVADLIFINKQRLRNEDKVTGKINNVFTSRYLYIYRGDIHDLQVESGKGQGFELWPLEKVLKAEASNQARFIPYIFKVSQTELAGFIKDLKL